MEQASRESVSRICNSGTWQEAHRFMYGQMMKLEDFYREYRDFLKYG